MRLGIDSLFYAILFVLGFYAKYLDTHGGWPSEQEAPAVFLPRVFLIRNAHIIKDVDTNDVLRATFYRGHASIGTAVSQRRANHHSNHPAQQLNVRVPGGE